MSARNLMTAAAILVATLAAPAAPAKQGGKCTLGSAPGLVGTLFTSRTESQARSLTGAAKSRVQRPGILYTTETKPDRVSIVLGKGDVVKKIRCA